MADASKTVFKSDSDVHITKDDQKKINLFAKFNARHEEIKTELKGRTNELKNYDDADDELSLRDDSDDPIPIQIGDNFHYMSASAATESLKKSRGKIEAEMKKLEDEGAHLREEMSNLKTLLYAKFGTHINLESEE